MRKNKAITLIALVVTIVVLLILAGVTLNIVLGENGIITQAKKAASSTVIASEREYLEQSIASMQIGQYTEDVSSERLGEALNSKNLENSSNWHIIKVNDKSYETGWNYVEKGTKLGDYGEVQDSWLINYETGEIIQLEEDNYMSLSATDTMYVKDHVIFNLDSSIIDGNVSNTKKDLERILGNGVELIGFDYNDESGLTNTSFNFDGKNDYISLPFEENPEELFDGGLTLEFYGILNGPGHEMLDNGEELQRPDNLIHDGASGLFQVVSESKDYGLLAFASEKYDNDLSQINWKIGPTVKRAPEGLGGQQR